MKKSIVFLLLLAGISANSYGRVIYGLRENHPTKPNLFRCNSAPATCAEVPDYPPIPPVIVQMKVYNPDGTYEVIEVTNLVIVEEGDDTIISYDLP